MQEEKAEVITEEVQETKPTEEKKESKPDVSSKEE